MEFTRRTMEKSRDLGKGLTFTAVAPEGEVGQTFYVADFRGVQLVLLQNDITMESYDFADGKRTNVYDSNDQIDRLNEVIDKDKTTLVVQHWPLQYLDYWEKITHFNKLMEGIPSKKAAFFTGHDHKQYTIDHTFNGQTYTDYTAAY